MKDHEIFDVIKSLNFKTDNYADAKVKLKLARNDNMGVYTKEQKKLFDEISKSETRYATAKAHKKNIFLKELTEKICSLYTYVTTDDLAEFAKHNGITKDEAQAIHSNAGIEIRKATGKQITATDLKPKSEIMLVGAALQPIEKGIEDLNKLAPTKISLYPGLSEVTNIYEVLACLFKGTQKDYRAKNSVEIKKLMDERGVEISTTGNADTADGILKSLLAAAGTNIFSSEEKRAKYDNYVIYNSVAMQKIIEKIKIVPPSSFNDETANPLIAQINDFFEDDIISISLFNDAAKLMKKPYIPKLVINVTDSVTCQCQNCGKEMSFKSEKELSAAIRCRHCNSALKLFLEIDYCVKPDSWLSNIMNVRSSVFYLSVKISVRKPSVHPFKTIPKMVIYANPSGDSIPSKETYTYKYEIPAFTTEDPQTVHVFSREIKGWTGIMFNGYSFKLYVEDDNGKFDTIETMRDNLRLAL